MQDEVVIEIEPDVTDKEVVVVEEPAKKVETVKVEPVADLKKQYEDMKRTSEADKAARAHAETVAHQSIQEAAKANDELTKARGEVVDSAMSAIETGLAAAQGEADAAEAEYASAFEAGDGKRMGAAQRKIARAEAKIQRLDEGKNDLEIRRAEAKIEKPEKTQERQQQPDPFERVLSSVTPRSAEWLRAHPEFVKDERLNKKANAAHNMALSEGHVADSDSYFDYCEKFLGLKKDEVVKTETKPRATVMTSAPVSREAVSMNGELSPTQVKLTPGEAKAATDGTIVWNHTDPKVGAVKGEPVGHREYARRKLAMEKQGLYDGNYTNQ